MSIEPDALVDLGTLQLELGGAIEGRVELDDGSAPSRQCQVRLETLQGGRVDRHGETVTAVAEGGSFELEGISPGSYRLTASQPDLLADTSDAIQVLPGKLVRLPKPLVVRRPASLELVFSPPVAPEGRSWQFEVNAFDPGGKRPTGVVRGKSGPDGTWFKEDLVPGTYEISVTGDVGSALGALRVELPSGWSSLLIELPVVLVEGYLRAGDEPLAGKVTLSRPEEKLSASFTADEAGSFSGVLAAEGQWQVTVEAPDEGISMSLDGIEVWAQGGSGVAVVEVRLPGTVLQGEVTDLLGSPMAGATLQLKRPGLVQETHRFETDADGWFRIRGLQPGAVSVMATAGELQSQSLDVILYEDRPGPALRIVVR